MRTLLLFLGLLLTAAPAWATAQQPERLHLDGEVLPLYSTPLAPLLAERKDLERAFPPTSSGCWRGYVGTWHVEGDRLLLVSLEREEAGEVVPFSRLFGDVQGPIPATWFTGTLRVPRSPIEHHVHMGFATSFDVELHLDVVRGRVVGRRRVDMRQRLRGRSRPDRTWVALAYTAHAPAHSDGTAPVDDAWVDARAIPSATFAAAHPEGEPFLTRGILDRIDDGPDHVLWIPETDVTAEVRLLLRTTPALGVERTWPHVELEATRHGKGEAVVLEVRWMRMLPRGETIHRPDFPLPPRSADARADPDEAGYAPSPCPVSSRDDVEGAFGVERLVELRGLLEDGDVPQVLGVEVAAAPGLVGQEVRAVGVLRKWVITERLLRLDPPGIAPFRNRGPGTWYRLVQAADERLAVPTAAK